MTLLSLASKVIVPLIALLVAVAKIGSAGLMPFPDPRPSPVAGTIALAET